MRGIARISLFAALPLMLLVEQASATPTQKCQEAKLKAQGKLQLCLKKNSAKVLGGKPDASSDCRAKFADGLSKAEHIAVAAGTTACRYVDNGDGTVSDLNTGLQWEQKDTTCPGPHCYNDIFTWTQGGAPGDLPYGDVFTDFLGGLNGGTSSDGTAPSGCFAGHCDWRLPTSDEMAVIIDLTQGHCSGGIGPCIDPIFGYRGDGTQFQAFYWSSTTASENPNEAWVGFFFNGYMTRFQKVLPNGARAVRGGF